MFIIREVVPDIGNTSIVVVVVVGYVRLYPTIRQDFCSI
jgi:hypothetical protein